MSVGIEHRVMLLSLTQCNWQFICSVLSLWTSSTHACMHIHYHGHSIQRAWTEVNESLNSLTILLLLARSALGTHVLRLCVSVHLLVCEQGCRDSPLSQSSLQSTWGIGNSSPPGALSIALPPPLCPEESTTRLDPGRAASPSLSLSLCPWRPLIHFFCRQNPSPFGTCLTEGKNEDEIAGSGSIPLIPLSISAVIHQPVVVVVDGVGVDAASVPYIFTESGAAELWLSTGTRDEMILGMFGACLE